MRRPPSRDAFPAAYRSACLLRETPAGESPRERLAASGGGALADPELLALCLGNGRQGADTLALARTVLEEAGGLTGLPALTLPALTRLGLTEAKAAAVLAAVELARRLALAAVPDRQLLTRPAEVATYLALRYWQTDQECMGALFLDVKGGLLGTAEIFRGTISRTAVEPRQVVREGLLRGAASVILFHTHPSGDATPSAEDLLFTRRMAQAGDLVGLVLRDHLIIGGTGRFASLKDRRAF
jgi:DNA repair protein RadC